ncbi:DUF6090 family protein [Pontimicrobium aquaticum]|uniref:Heme biosynthesis protein HemY n=1 Tax=Pontimicrobium aquaticum TaxID=2565367 RepID=A0A4U0F1H4_9FLAO|nr:DUF6090 family protein [Pontimicrobium aquaticum]TJY36462.1 heme biosynthesis protein HemY [Pontimicrobium aquaticum]
MENKTGKYFKYAIGEIVLVVIGILIALQINNWNEQRKNNKSRKQLVQGLISEFEANYNQLEIAIKKDSINLKAGLKLQQLMKSPREVIQDSIIINLLTKLENYTFNPTNGALKSGISSGHIHFIKNNILKEKLFAWDDIVKDAQEEELLYRADYINRVSPFLETHTQTADQIELYKKYIPKSKFKSNFFELMSNPQFENLLVNRSILLLDALVELKPIRESNKLIIELLKQELTDN